MYVCIIHVQYQVDVIIDYQPYSEDPDKQSRYNAYLKQSKTGTVGM